MNTSMELGPTLGLAVLMSVASLQADAVRGYAWAFGTADRSIWSPQLSQPC
ncbi:hypothetical protein M3650_19330 [Paenibacillus sp. MER TA 81-3]|uniref:hypothetical protein n=1 Tax=Paenibacillus sp. MER TA 81-3 TaxID=2939573 RepID=UPI00203CAA6F|nr:hypothetical protein [Paenibacillus sp. MER TA 81-3]MCM3340721.1 hypothetical protein [Paenibacillus sp. MER TA 81-3]